jgi:hypothetical protein
MDGCTPSCRPSVCVGVNLDKAHCVRTTRLIGAYIHTSQQFQRVRISHDWAIVPGKRAALETIGFPVHLPPLNSGCQASPSYPLPLEPLLLAAADPRPTLSIGGGFCRKRTADGTDTHVRLRMNVPASEIVAGAVSRHDEQCTLKQKLARCCLLFRRFFFMKNFVRNSLLGLFVAPCSLLLKGCHSCLSGHSLYLCRVPAFDSPQNLLTILRQRVRTHNCCTSRMIMS